MRITALTAQVRDPNRVNISVDGKFRFSLDISQVVDLGVKQGQEVDAARLAELEEQSQLGKLYARSLDYCLARPHSEKEVSDYLWRKTIARRYRSKRTGEIKETVGVSVSVTHAVLRRLVERGYVDDVRFAQWWVENRKIRQGVSTRKLESELRAKGLSSEVIYEAIHSTSRDELDELRKMIAKKSGKYDDQQKLIAYLARQGFDYDSIRRALISEDEL